MKREDTAVIIVAIIFAFALMGAIVGFSIHPVKNDIKKIESSASVTISETEPDTTKIVFATETTTEEAIKNTTASLSSFSSTSSIIQTHKDNLLDNSSKTSKPPTSKAFSLIKRDSSFSSISAITFYYDDGEPVYISAEEYYTICSIVMGEAGMTYEGSVAVAQSIRNQIIREKKLGHKYDIASIRSTYQLYYDKKPNDTARRAVTDVFHNHIVVTKEPIIAWVSDGYYSEWHSSQIKVGSWGGNTFYKLKNQDF